MSIYKNGKLIAGGRQCMPLLSFMWADHQLNDVSWLRADTFSWQSGAVYEAAYQHLADDIDGKTLQSETVGGVTVQFYLADDGHKICPASEESNVAAIYTATGVAWYYIIDTTNQRFKLPRTKHNKYNDKNIPVFGNGEVLGLTDGNGRSGVIQSYIWKGGYNMGMGLGGDPTNRKLPTSFIDVRTAFSPLGVDPDYTKSGLTAQAQSQDTDQYKYLYFYVGNFTQTALENTAGLNAELFNGKVDTGHQVIAFQTPTAQNNYTWYRLYADGWVEQGGALPVTVDSAITITIPVEMADINYTLQLTRTFSAQNTGSANNGGIATWNKTTTSFMCWGKYYDTVTDNWTVCGMAA